MRRAESEFKEALKVDPTNLDAQRGLFKASIFDEVDATRVFVSSSTSSKIDALNSPPWALTIMRSGGTTIIPQEPFRSHDEYLLPARPMALWHFTDLKDPRFEIGKHLIQLSTDETRNEPQKIGVLNKQGWAAYYREPTLFVKEFEFIAGANYPDYGCNCETYTAGGFMEVESLGPMEVLQPNESTKHTERWSLFPNVYLSGDEKQRAIELLRLLRG